MNYKNIANIIPTIQSAHLVSHNIKASKKKKKTSKDMLELGMTNIIGTNMIKINADTIASL